MSVIIIEGNLKIPDIYQILKKDCNNPDNEKVKKTIIKR